MSDVLHESSSIALLDGDEILYVARSSTTRRIMSVDLGDRHAAARVLHIDGTRAARPSRRPPSATATSRRVKLVAHTSGRRSRRTSCARSSTHVVRAGYAIVDQELELGLRSIAVPVRDLAGKVVAAMNISTQASRVSVAELEQRLLPELKLAARAGQLLARHSRGFCDEAHSSCRRARADRRLRNGARTLGRRIAPADLREGSCRSRRSCRATCDRSGKTGAIPQGLSPSRLHPDADRLHRQARHAAADGARSGGALCPGQGLAARRAALTP